MYTNHRQFVAVPTQRNDDNEWLSTVDQTYWHCVCCVGSLGLPFLLWHILVQYITSQTIASVASVDRNLVDEFCGPTITWASLVENSWWPGCGFTGQLTNWSTCGACFDADFMHAMMQFNRNNPASLVSYTPRQAENAPRQIMLKGWWLPAPARSPGPNPRIVLQHGHSSNSNNYRTQAAAYMLRAMGFDVLVNNLRDHCYSDVTSHEVALWGHGEAYTHDLLGAWDYARQDPHGILGGPVAAGQVGIMGFSKGGLTTLNAFGHEAYIPGVWVDSPPLSPKSSWKHGLQKQLDSLSIGGIADALVEPVWSNVELRTGVVSGTDFNEHIPERTLPLGPSTRRPVFCAANKNDPTVPFVEHLRLLGLLEMLRDKYSIRGRLVSSQDCNGEHHCADHLRKAQDYGRLLCQFWSEVFSTSEARCELASLKAWHRPQTVTSTSSPAPTATSTSSPAPTATSTSSPAPTTSTGIFSAVSTTTAGSPVPTTTAKVRSQASRTVGSGTDQESAPIPQKTVTDVHAAGSEVGVQQGAKCGTCRCRIEEKSLHEPLCAVPAASDEYSVAESCMPVFPYKPGLNGLMDGIFEEHCFLAHWDVLTEAQINEAAWTCLAPGHAQQGYTEQPRRASIRGSFTVDNVDYKVLSDTSSLKEAFEEACRNVIATQAACGVSSDDIGVVLSSGSDTADFFGQHVSISVGVAYNYNMTTVAGDGAQAAREKLTTESFQLGLVSTFSGVPGIDTAVTGKIKISHVNASLVTDEEQLTVRRLDTLVPRNRSLHPAWTTQIAPGPSGRRIPAELRRTLFLLGDSLAVALYPGIKAAVAGHFSARLFAINGSDGSNCWCGFMPVTRGCVAPDAGLQRSMCLAFNERASEIIERRLQEGDVLAVAHFDRWGAAVGEVPSIHAYVLHLKALQSLVVRRGASLLLFGPVAILPVPGPMCATTLVHSVSQAVRACEVVQAAENQIHSTLEEALTELSGLARTYVFSFRDLLCDGQICNALIPGTNILAYRDQMHLTLNASHYLSPFLCSFLTTHGLMPSGGHQHSNARSWAPGFCAFLCALLALYMHMRVPDRTVSWL